MTSEYLFRHSDNELLRMVALDGKPLAQAVGTSGCRSTGKQLIEYHELPQPGERRAAVPPGALVQPTRPHGPKPDTSAHGSSGVWLKTSATSPPRPPSRIDPPAKWIFASELGNS